MDFDSSEIMENFPGLFSSEKKKDKTAMEETAKKDAGKRKEKKDKDKGYAALEGESSDEASSSKSKKNKAFIFTKSKEKERGAIAKKIEPKKHQKGHKSKGESSNARQFIGVEVKLVSDALPIFGVSLFDAVQRGKCHDGIDIPLPIRESIDFLEANGLHYEYVYKAAGSKNRVAHLKKMYNGRQIVKFADFDVPTATTLVKDFLRELPEPIFTNDLIIRFEEAGAILNFNTREKHLKQLIDSLPGINKLLLSWLITHFHNITLKEHINKMSILTMSQTLNHTMHISSRLLQALIIHREGLFPGVTIIQYFAPLESGSTLPDNPKIIQKELNKLESVLTLIHWEMQNGHFSKTREAHLWEVQRISTELKRKLKKYGIATTNTSTVTTLYKAKEKKKDSKGKKVKQLSEAAGTSAGPGPSTGAIPKEKLTLPINFDRGAVEISEAVEEILKITDSMVEKYTGSDSDDSDVEINFDKKQAKFLTNNNYFFTEKLKLESKNDFLKEIIDKLNNQVESEQEEIEDIEKQVKKRTYSQRKGYRRTVKDPKSFKEFKALLAKENNMLQMKKMDLVRDIVEQQEECVELQAKVSVMQEEPEEAEGASGDNSVYHFEFE